MAIWAVEQLVWVGNEKDAGTGEGQGRRPGPGRHRCVPHQLLAVGRTAQGTEEMSQRVVQTCTTPAARAADGDLSLRGGGGVMALVSEGMWSRSCRGPRSRCVRKVWLSAAGCDGADDEVGVSGHQAVEAEMACG